MEGAGSTVKDAEGPGLGNALSGKPVSISLLEEPGFSARLFDEKKGLMGRKSPGTAQDTRILSPAVSAPCSQQKPMQGAPRGR